MTEYTITRPCAELDLEALRTALASPDHMQGPKGAVLRGLLAQIEEQVKPAVEEPLDFGSLVRASNGARKRVLWQQAPHIGGHYWINAFRDAEPWSELTDVEVLRVGLGETSADSASDVETAGVYANGIVQGRAVMSQWVLVKLRALLAEAITSERKNAYEKAIQAVEELAP